MSTSAACAADCAAYSSSLQGMAALISDNPSDDRTGHRADTGAFANPCLIGLATGKHQCESRNNNE